MFDSAGPGTQGRTTPPVTVALGRLEVTPGEDELVDPGRDFSATLRYEPPDGGLPAGTRLHIVPFAHRRAGTASAEVIAGDERVPLPVEVDHSYSSRTVDEPGSPVCFGLPLAEGLDADGALEFRYDISAADVERSHYTLDGPCHAGFVVWLVSPEGEKLGELPTPQWQFKTASPQRMALVLPSQAEVGEPVPLIVRITGADAPTFDYAGEVAIEMQDDVRVEGDVQFGLAPDDAGRRELRVRFEQPGVYRLSATAEGGFAATSNPIRVGQTGEAAIYWGVMHWHTHYSWDSRNVQPTCMTPRDALRYARDMSLLDFMSVSDHGQHNDRDAFSTSDPRMPQVDMTEADWERYQAETLEFDEADILAFVGYEHRDPRGDTNVLFRGEGSYFLENGRRRFVDDVWASAGADDVLTFPQLHLRGSLADYRQASPHEQLVEIRSFHAAFEYYLNPQPFTSYASVEVKHGAPGDRVFVQELLGLGRRLGFVANDDHGDLPGNGGVTAVMADERSHDGVFEALQARRAYATTGARIIVGFDVEGISMGDERRIARDGEFATRRVASYRVHGTAPIERISLLRNNEVIAEESPDSLDAIGNFEDDEPLSDILLKREVGDVQSAYYYLRVVQADGQTAWSSPVFLLER